MAVYGVWRGLVGGGFLVFVLACRILCLLLLSLSVAGFGFL